LSLSDPVTQLSIRMLRLEAISVKLSWAPGSTDPTPAGAILLAGRLDWGARYRVRTALGDAWSVRAEALRKFKSDTAQWEELMRAALRSTQRDTATMPVEAAAVDLSGMAQFPVLVQPRELTVLLPDGRAAHIDWSSGRQEAAYRVFQLNPVAFGSINFRLQVNPYAPEASRRVYYNSLDLLENGAREFTTWLTPDADGRFALGALPGDEFGLFLPAGEMQVEDVKPSEPRWIVASRSGLGPYLRLRAPESPVSTVELKVR